LEIYLTPAALSYLTQLILVALISIYFFTLARRQAQPPPHLYWLTAFFWGITAFVATLFLESALPVTPRLPAVFWQVPFLACSWFCLIQFAYRFPVLPPALRREARLVSFFVGLYAAWEVGFVFHRYQQLRLGLIEYRIDWTDYLLLAVLLIAPLIFLRQIIYHCPVPGRSRFWFHLGRAWRNPPTPACRALHDFALIFLFVAALGVFNLLRTYYYISVALANAGISFGILIALALFALAYINQREETTSFMVKLVGITLTTMLGILGVAAWVIALPHMADYAYKLDTPRALRFTPTANGGYEIAAIPFLFEGALGQNLYLDDGATRGCSEPLAFHFPFYDKVYDALYVCNDGFIAPGAPIRYREYQYNYGAGAPLLLPLLIDLDPTISEGGVFARQEGDRLIVTWDRLRLFQQPEKQVTVQAVLYADGAFDFVYAAAPERLTFQPNDNPVASLWAIGTLPGDRQRATPKMVLLDELTLSGKPVIGGPEGALQDFYLEFRANLHRLLLPLAWLIFAASAFILSGFPLLFYVSLVRPLHALLAGVRRMEAGEYGVAVPAPVADEIGLLSRAFNKFSGELGDLIHNLEERVAERTQELNAAKSVAETQSERAKAAAAAKTAFLAHMSHELRTPLNAILGFSDLMSHDAVLTPQQRSHLNIINRSGEHLLALINDVLDFSKIDAARVTVNAAPFNLRRLLDDLISMFSLRAAQKRLWLVADLDPMLPDFIVADQSKLRQILINLLGNAVKFTSEGEISLRVHLVAKPAMLQFVVQDTGVGIAAEDLERIFDPFVQTQIPGQLQEGTGLGLAISREFARLLEGDLHVCSVVGRGSAFTLELPLCLADGVEKRPCETPSAQVIGLSADQPAYRLLVADDASTTRELLRELLLPLGFAVREAENGHQAVETWRAWQPHLIFMDINMPEIDGIAATRQIRAVGDAASAPVIVAMSASVSLEDRQVAQQAGCDDFLAKPFPLPSVLSLLADRLGVVYLYNQDQAQTTAVVLDETDVTHHLATLPSVWLKDLVTAAQTGDVNWLDDLLREWPDGETAVADYLTDMAHKFDHERLSSLATNALTHHQTCTFNSP
jgi:signal transduction histidine kinase/CheY-like chemotaxis protein